ncbi:MAG: endonuclease/exonuclease/phosphatase family protein [Spirochaetes bacterium]|nr:endonuclease/exonuclease/phosphatase family protein [Spirochaetota bacterium]
MKPLFPSLLLLMVMISIQSLFGHDIKIISFNVWHGMNRATFFEVDEYETREKREMRFRIFVDYVKTYSPDILAIQEANPIPHYVKKLSRALNYHSKWRITNCGIKFFGIGIPQNFSEGLAVLSKKEHKLEYVASRRISGSGIQTEIFSFHTTSARYIVVTKVTVDKRPLLVFNIHAHFALIPHEGLEKKIDELIVKENLPPERKKDILSEIEIGYQKTENEILQLLSFVKEITIRHNHPYIIAGDFNTTDKSPAFRTLIRDLSLLDAFAVKNPTSKGYTWDPHTNSNARLYDGSPYRADGKRLRKGIASLEAEFDRSVARRIDFILLSKHFTEQHIKSARIVFNEAKDGMLPSDHYGVEVVITEIPCVHSVHGGNAK